MDIIPKTNNIGGFCYAKKQKKSVILKIFRRVD